MFLVEAARLASNALVDRRTAAWSSLHATGTREDGDIGSREDGDIGSFFFVAYQHWYIFFCSVLLCSAHQNGWLSQTVGLDFELCIVWLLEVMIVHLVCAAIVCWKAQSSRMMLPSFGGKILMSIFRICSEKFEMLRDFITSAIHVKNQAYGCAIVSIISILIPMIYRDKESLAFLFDGYVPVIRATYAKHDDSTHLVCTSGLC